MSSEFQKHLAQRKLISLYHTSALDAVTRQIPGYQEMWVYTAMVLGNKAQRDGPRLQQHIEQVHRVDKAYRIRSNWARRVSNLRKSKL